MFKHVVFLQLSITYYLVFRRPNRRKEKRRLMNSGMLRLGFGSITIPIKLVSLIHHSPSCSWLEFPSPSASCRSRSGILLINCFLLLLLRTMQRQMHTAAVKRSKRPTTEQNKITQDECVSFSDSCKIENVQTAMAHNFTSSWITKRSEVDCNSIQTAVDTR